MTLGRDAGGGWAQQWLVCGRGAISGGGPDRAGSGRLDVLVAVVLAVALFGVVLPGLLWTTETARRWRCQYHLARLATALHAYDDTFGTLPPAAWWHRTSGMQSLALHRTRRFEQVTYANWAVLLLPYVGEGRLAERFDGRQPVGASVNQKVCATRLAVFSCPSDGFNRKNNPFEHRPLDGGPSLCFARGNYAINGGSHSNRVWPGPSGRPVGDGPRLLMDHVSGRYQFWGNGVAGINKCFRLDQFVNGRSTLVALEEVRAGVDPLDPRGVWALGQIGSSITWAHGVNGDDYGPNNPWPRADDIRNCDKLDQRLGRDTLQALGMPCCWYCKRNEQATARSQHPGGVQVAFLDGAVRFVSDHVDPGLWHVLHSRETPPEVFPEDWESQLTPPAGSTKTDDRTETFRSGSTAAAEGSGSGWTARGPEPAAAASPRSAPTTGGPATLVNSIGMTFVRIPAGEFLMGEPDDGGSAPPECPPHPVRLTRPFYLSVCEVTREQFRRVLGAAPATDPPDPEDFPVRNVTWYQAAEFCRRLSRLPAEQAAGRHYRLPTEAEWEYACRAGGDGAVVDQDGRSVRTEPEGLAGPDWRPGEERGRQAGRTSGRRTARPLHPVGACRPNRWGLFDLQENVWEWCADWFDRDYYARSPLEDPTGPATGFLKVVRGGPWRFTGEPCRIDYAMMPPWKANPLVGFRVVCEVHPSQTTGSDQPPSSE